MILYLSFNPLPDDKILDATKVKAYADNNSDVAKIMISLFNKEKKNCGKRRKCWEP